MEFFSHVPPSASVNPVCPQVHCTLGATLARLLPLILPFAFFGSHTSRCNSSGLCVCVTVRDPKHNTDLFPSKLNNLLTKSRLYTRVKNIIHLVGVVFFSVQYFKASLHLFLISGVNICLSSYIISPLQRIKQTQTTY